MGEALSTIAAGQTPVAESQSRGAAMMAFIGELFPICRSITGPGVRETLRRIGEHIPIKRTEVPTGTKVFDWDIPEEWSIREAHVTGPGGKRVIDFAEHTLHILNYSVPVRATMPLAELRKHLHTLPARPDWIPYRTSHYKRDWGFCLTQRALDALPDGDYQVVIDTTIAPGSLTLGECYLPGEVEDEVLFYAHVCHPSMCNDNLSGIAVATFLARALAAMPRRRLSYRFVFGPATIGSISWLSLNEARVKRIKHGLALASLGDAGHLTFKRSRRGDTDTDRILDHVMKSVDGSCEDFTPYGYDERQFCSPGFDLAFGRLTRTSNGLYPEYHTSADNLSFISAQALEGSLDALMRIVELFEANVRYLNLSPKGEPRLGPRGLFSSKYGLPPGEFEHALLWMLNQSDGGHDLLDIVQRSKIDARLLDAAARALVDAGLLAQQPA